MLICHRSKNGAMPSQPWYSNTRYPTSGKQHIVDIAMRDVGVLVGDSATRGELSPFFLYQFFHKIHIQGHMNEVQLCLVGNHFQHSFLGRQ